MPTITDWIMVIITGVYVGATILICVYNNRSAQASKEQVAETKRQYEEENRAYITYELLYVRRAFYGIRFTNHGKRIANHIQIIFNQEFIDSITEPSFSRALNILRNKKCVLGIGQNYDVFFGTNEFLKNPDKVPLEGQLAYTDDKASYCEPFFIDIEHYATLFSVNSEHDDLLEAIKKQTMELEQIKLVLKRNVCDYDQKSIPPT